MGVASGVVAALVATVFAVLFNQVGAQRNAADEAQHAQDVASTVTQLRQLVDHVQVATRGRLAADAARAEASVKPLLRTAAELARGDPTRSARLQTIERDFESFLESAQVSPSGK